MKSQRSTRSWTKSTSSAATAEVAAASCHPVKRRDQHREFFWQECWLAIGMAQRTAYRIGAMRPTHKIGASAGAMIVTMFDTFHTR